MGEGGGMEGGIQEEDEESPRNITALIFHPGSRARCFAPVFNITPRSRMFYPPPPTITSPPSRLSSLLSLPTLGAFRTKAAVSRLVTNLRY